MGDNSKTRERPTMGRIRELEASLQAATAEAEAMRHERDLLADEVKTLAVASIPGTVEETSAEYVSIPVADLTALMDEMAEAVTQGRNSWEKIRTNKKASYGQRLHGKFLEGTTKTAAYFLEKLSKVVES